LATERDEDVNSDAEEVVEVEEDELVEDELEDEETIPEASTSPRKMFLHCRILPLGKSWNDFSQRIPPTGKWRTIFTNTLAVGIASSTGRRLGWPYFRAMAMTRFHWPISLNSSANTCCRHQLQNQVLLDRA
jgi:hypothetical protein